MNVFDPIVRHLIEPFPSTDERAGVPIPDRCLVGMREQLTPVGETEKATTWNGRTRILTVPWKRKYNVRLSNSGPGVQAFPVEEFWPGRPLRFQASNPTPKPVPQGRTEVVLDRLPATASVTVRDRDDKPVRVAAFDGKRIVLAAPADERTFVWYRPVLDVVVVDVGDLGSGYTDREVSWSLELEEEYAPL